MADVELVIKIPEEMYQTIKETNVVISGRRSGRRFDYILFDAVSTGTPLPKGHDKLIDVKDLLELLCLEDTEQNRKLNIGEHITLEDIDRIEPIIEADKE